MQLDSTDTDLAIEKLRAQTAQLDDATTALNVAKVNVETQQQSFRQIDSQRAAAENIRNDIAVLTQQKKFLEVTFDTSRARRRKNSVRPVKARRNGCAECARRPA